VKPLLIGLSKWLKNNNDDKIFMKTILSIIQFLYSKGLKLKSKLPYNGDWLFVTGNLPDEEDEQKDLEDDYDAPEKVLQNFNSNNLDVIKITYDRVKAHELRIDNLADQTRDKAKILLTTSSVVSAIFLGVISFFPTSITMFNIWVITIELLIFLLLAAHLIHALIRAISVITREGSVYTPPHELLGNCHNAQFSNEDHPLSSYKKAISQILAYSNQTHKYILERSNKLILGQHAFKYGLEFFFILIVFHMVAFISSANIRPQDPIAKLNEFEKKISSTIITKQNDIINEINKLIREISLGHQDNKNTIEEMKKTQQSLIKVEEELVNEISLWRQYYKNSIEKIKENQELLKVEDKKEKQ